MADNIKLALAAARAAAEDHARAHGREHWTNDDFVVAGVAFEAELEKLESRNKAVDMPALQQ